MGFKTPSSTFGIKDPINQVSINTDTYFCIPIQATVDAVICPTNSDDNSKECHTHKVFCSYIPAAISVSYGQSFHSYFYKASFFVGDCLKKSPLFLIRSYQKYISSATSPKCRYLPTCSDYAYEALTVHGLFKGIGLTFLRILRCHPWATSRVDPVPDQETKSLVRERKLLPNFDKKGCMLSPVRSNISACSEKSFET